MTIDIVKLVKSKVPVNVSRVQMTYFVQSNINMSLRSKYFKKNKFF